jgi:catechol 2,3-dioxygenase-like lactoylglutathione lyase family enzyme
MTWTPPLTAMCVLGQDVDAHRAFYTEILGLTVNRREEGFVNFKARDGMAICVWEIGHIHTHLGYATHDGAAVATKSIVMLPVASRAEVEAAARAPGVEVVAAPGMNRHREYATILRGPDGASWEIVAAPEHAAGDQVGSNARRLTLICDDLAASRDFYASKLELAVTRTDPAFSVYATTRCPELEILARAAAPGALAAPLTPAQRAAHLVMGAFGYAETADVHAVHRRLAPRGVTFSGEPIVHAWKFLAGYFVDPDATIWEVFSPVRADVGKNLLG